MRVFALVRTGLDLLRTGPDRFRSGVREPSGPDRTGPAPSRIGWVPDRSAWNPSGPVRTRSGPVPDQPRYSGSARTGSTGPLSKPLEHAQRGEQRGERLAVLECSGILRNKRSVGRETRRIQRIREGDQWGGVGRGERGSQVRLLRYPVQFLSDLARLSYIPFVKHHASSLRERK